MWGGADSTGMILGASSIQPCSGGSSSAGSYHCSSRGRLGVKGGGAAHMQCAEQLDGLSGGSGSSLGEQRWGFSAVCKVLLAASRGLQY
jgi:hypothetical protein